MGRYEFLGALKIFYSVKFDREKRSGVDRLKEMVRFSQTLKGGFIEHVDQALCFDHRA